MNDEYFIDTSADSPAKKMPAPKDMMDGGMMMMMPAPKPKDGGVDGDAVPAPTTTDGGAMMMMPGDTTQRVSTPVELAHGKSTSASSEQTSKGNWASLANDGDSATRWSASSAGTPAWWRVDLGAVHRVTRVEIDWEFARPYGYRVEISSDDVQYDPLVDRSTSADTTQKQFADVSTSCRYVRITVTQVTISPISWPSFSEVRVFGN